MSINDKLKNKASNFQPKSTKNPYENTGTYQNSLRTNRIDPRIFSIYKIADEPKGSASDYAIYVDNNYVQEDYIEIITKFNP